MSVASSLYPFQKREVLRRPARPVKSTLPGLHNSVSKPNARYRVGLPGYVGGAMQAWTVAIPSKIANLCLNNKEAAISALTVVPGAEYCTTLLARVRDTSAVTPTVYECLRANCRPLGQRSAGRYVVISVAAPPVVWPLAKRNLLAYRDTSQAIGLVNARRLIRPISARSIFAAR